MKRAEILKFSYRRLTKMDKTRMEKLSYKIQIPKILVVYIIKKLRKDNHLVINKYKSIMMNNKLIHT
jgi:hypothetical protein